MSDLGRGARYRSVGVCLLLALSAVAGLGASAASAAPATLWTRCDGGEGDIGCSVVRGVGVAPATASAPGTVYVADLGLEAINQFGPWGDFRRSWGWDVVASGPGDNGVGFEICVPADGDVCKAGVAGAGAGQFGGLFGPQGVAVDSLGNVYVTDADNLRVQKFSPTGEFLRMWGKGVNTGTSGNPNLCTDAGPPTDVCGAGSAGTGSGEFGGWGLGSNIAVGPGDKVWVGDKGRIQQFDTEGAFVTQFTAGLLATDQIKSVAADRSGNVYGVINGKANVRKWSPAGAALTAITVASPVAVAADIANLANNLFVISGSSNAVIRRFNGLGTELESWGQEEPPSPKLGSSTGIAASSACRATAGSANVYVTNPGPTFARAYGPNPDLCPKPVKAPQIASQYALSVGSRTATLQAQINPNFFEDTTYFAQHATAECLEGPEEWDEPCVEEKPVTPAALGAGGDLPVTTGSILLTGLSPDTEYGFRFIAQSSGGGPVFGEEESFTTVAEPVPVSESCANDAFRGGSGAFLPDCRAYEMVSPVDKGGADAVSIVDSFGNPTARNQSTVDGGKLAYSAERAFGDAVSQPYTSQYIATRGAGGWSTHAISPPRGAIGLVGGDNEFQAFSEDLCSAWLVTDNTTAPPLTADGEEGANNVYKRSSCGAEGYEALGWGQVNTDFQGFSADTSKAIFTAAGHLSQEAATPVGDTIGCTGSSQAEAKTFQWLRNGEAIGGATNPNYTPTAAEEGKAVQCRVRSANGALGAVQASNPVWVVAPYPATEPPRAPEAIAAPSADAPLGVGGAGGQTLSCDPNAAEWEGAPSFAFQWYRNGTAIAGATTATYTVSAEEVASAAGFQCEVLATNAGGNVAKASKSLATSPAPSEPGLPGAVAQPRDQSGSDGPLAYLAVGGERDPQPFCVLPGGRTQAKSCSAGMLGLFSGIGYQASVKHALSEDGKRIYWSDLGGLPFGGPKPLYLRENPAEPQSALDGEGNCTEADKACTVLVNAAQVQFWGASPDGSRAIYRTGSPESLGDLFEFNAEAGPEGESEPIAGGVSGLVGMSEDLSRIYLVSSEALDGAAQAGKPNLYLYEAGAFSFIATLADADRRVEAEAWEPSPISAFPVGHAARVSPDGDTAVFVSTGSLTGYDNTDAISGEADTEVFRYEAASGALECVSCNPSGGRPVGRHVEDEGKDEWVAATIPGAEHQLYFSRVLSDDGERLFFESFEKLVLADRNDRKDVYQWEALGKGSCTAKSPAFSEPNGGCLSLISSGQSGKDSRFADATPSGNDVFFATDSSLVAGDPGLIDIYDARVGGGFPPPLVKPPCEGDSCQSPPAPPAFTTPGSANVGRPSGNVQAQPKKRKCPKGKHKVRRNGKERCVKRQKRAASKSRRAGR